MIASWFEGHAVVTKGCEVKVSRQLVWWLVALLLVRAAGASPGEQTELRPNVALILIDTLRKNHVGAFGYPLDTTPFIDSLAADGLVFTNAVSQAPWTAPSMASIWTSRYPHEVGVQAVSDENGVKNIDKLRATSMGDGFRTLAELLGMEGYRTIAVTENPYSANRYGLLRGFEDRIIHPTKWGAEKMVDDALATLQSPGAGADVRPFFVYLHFVDVHQPTHPPEPYDTMFETLDGALHKHHHYNWAYEKRGADLKSERYKIYRSHKLALYDGSLRYIDAQIERFAGALEALGYLDETIFVIASDHGEEFWEHSDFEELYHLDPRNVVGVSHGHSLFSEVIDVPLVISGPGVPAQVVRSQVRNLDIAPTVLGLVGADRLGADMRGEDLVKWVEAGSVELLPAYSEDLAYGVEAKSIQDGVFKYVEYSNTKSGPAAFMYRHGDEHRNVLEDYPERAKKLREELRKISSANRLEGNGTQKAAPLDEMTLKHLRELGYGE